jgi:tRNA threonylcarbamoyladenosine biosynthesis protein TsaE
MPSWEVVSQSQEETIQKGKELGAQLIPRLRDSVGVLVLLFGELGSGKTTLAKGIISGLGAASEEEVTSPTFTLVHAFRNPATTTRVYHVDLYRVSDAHDLETLGLEDVFTERAVVIVEWAERLRLRTDWPRVEVRLEHVAEQSRRIVVLDAEDLLGA